MGLSHKKIDSRTHYRQTDTAIIQNIGKIAIKHKKIGLNVARLLDRFIWRRDRGSNPRYLLQYARFPNAVCQKQRFFYFLGELNNEDPRRLRRKSKGM